ncbi:hypothetical protein [Prevotella intermedia]|uniref:Lipocalin-like domain-containing protein n=2 Tax=Prevotella intermedia TaxID=28131 RepID=A0A0S3ULI0_PREIN|nr:hypothetical protein [Prevotella intermedia]ATV55019.1 hypothetical protein CTM61_06040 [Prevotella intermedia]AWX06823.1 hypothetical protein CTM55_03870 [Prevotella intermedia]KJJ86985.1 hypothetical protein M573_112031 [Prevotella intermedia ZT]OWP33447.1 hypothetical protein CBG55_04485 [Prevotella intermedia]PJI20010.1 hypothetical protein CTM53_03750 [Prevotella intermedia]
MKKLLLLALVAFFGVSAQAQDKPEVITEKPAGTETVYKRVSGKMFAIQNGKLSIFDIAKLAENDQPAGDLTVITAADGKTVYLKYVLSYASYIKDDKAGGWVKGTKNGNTITVPAGQYILYGEFEDGEYGIRVGYLELKGNNFEVLNDDITFTIDGNTAVLNGTIMEGESQEDLKLKMLGGYWSDDQSFFCGDVETVFSTNPTGIETVERGANKQVVGETYFDLSGRQLSKAGKGVAIKSIKFADGTTKSVKYIGK